MRQVLRKHDWTTAVEGMNMTYHMMDAQTLAEVGEDAASRLMVPTQTGEYKVPERSLSKLMSEILNGRFGSGYSRCEQRYTDISNQLGIPMAQNHATFGGCQADIATYDRELPTAVVEIKVFDERGISGDLHRDLVRASRILPSLRSFVGVLVCETAKRGLQIRTEHIKRILDRQVVTTIPRVVKNWQWCFLACARV